MKASQQFYALFWCSEGAGFDASELPLQLASYTTPSLCIIAPLISCKKGFAVMQQVIIISNYTCLFSRKEKTNVHTPRPHSLLWAAREGHSFNMAKAQGEFIVMLKLYLCPLLLDLDKSPWGKILGSREARCPHMRTSCRPAGQSTRRNTLKPVSTLLSSPRNAQSDGRQHYTPVNDYEVTCFWYILRMIMAIFSPQYVLLHLSDLVDSLAVAMQICNLNVYLYIQPMSPKEKGKFEDMAKQDKVRYEREMKNYIPPNGQKKKRFKDPNAPKRPPYVPQFTGFAWQLDWIAIIEVN